MSAMLQRPAADEHAPSLEGYISHVPAGDVRVHLRTQMHETIGLFTGVDEARAGQGYGPGKWSLKEVIGHINDAERVFAYRLLRVARGDQTPLPGFEQDEWVPTSRANERSLASLLLEFAAIRASTMTLIDSIPDEAWLRRVTAGGKPVSARALVYVMAGHERHHVEILRARYVA